MHGGTGAVLGAATLLMLGGCALMEPADCPEDSWRDSGFADGRRGVEAGRGAELASACRGEPPADLAAWREGHAEGLRLYCEPGRIFDFGAEGLPPPAVCEGVPVDGLAEAWERGREVHAMNHAIAVLDRQLAAQARRRDAVDDALEALGLELLLTGADGEARDAMVARARALAAERNRLDAFRASLTEVRDRHAEALAARRATVAMRD